MKIKCIFDDRCYAAKPESKEVGGIINRMTIDKAKEYSIDEIKENILKGKTIRPSYCGSKEESWISQQVFMIDIDNEAKLTDDIVLGEFVKLVDGKKDKVRFLAGSEQHRSYEQVINHCKQINLIPTFIYTSFNHKPEQHKFRLVFVLDKPITDYETAKKIQLYIMQAIGNVDEQCKNLNRIYYAGNQIVCDSGNVLNADRLKDIILDNPKPLTSRKPIIIKQKTNIDYIKTLDIKGLQGCLRKGGTIEESNILYSIVPPKTPLQIVTNRNELYQAIGKIDLAEFLGLDSYNFKCVFHDDKNASASIFIGDDGKYIYKCHSASCGFVGGIVRIVERLAKCNKPTAINFIKAVYGIELQESEWQKQQKEILQANIDYLLSDQMEYEYPELYKRIKNYIPLLVCLHNIAMNNVKDENIIDTEDVAFFTSIRNIMKEVNTSSFHISDKINLFAFLELINKLDPSQIPEHLLGRAKWEAEKKKQKYLVSFYSIPSYSDEKLNNADEMAKLFKEKNMTMKGWSRELLLRTFGKEVANRVYPQFKDVGISKSSYKFEKAFTEVLFYLIEKQGYATEQQCIKHLKGYKELNHVRVKRILQDVLDKYDLKRVRANKEIKKQYGITGNGYPFIIIRDE